jgi:DNA-directed RNA polymerase specialized sigma24 family protein
MLQATHIKRANEFEYATAADFCQIFGEDVNSLFLLALLLTGDQEEAEQCFVAALENAINRRTVFKEWARSWARRAIIQAAQCMINPRPSRADEALTMSAFVSSNKPSHERIEIAAVRRLEPFDRFVFVMSILERYSDHECAILLGTRRREVIEARTRALEQLGREVEARLVSDRVYAGTAESPVEKPELEFRVFARSA